ncbi:MAG: holo-ACP synthase [Nitrososphaerota archaeon]
MKVTVGVDIISLSRIKRAIERSGRLFLRKVYTDKELELGNDIGSLATRFAGKEAVFKALRMHWRGNASLKDIEILKGEFGEPIVVLHGMLKEAASSRGIQDIVLTLSYNGDYAIACAIALYNKKF